MKCSKNKSKYLKIYRYLYYYGRTPTSDGYINCLLIGYHGLIKPYGTSELHLFKFFFTVPFYGLALYTYYHGIVQHSGITFKAQWWQPWQPDCMFHDNHHQYCHVNYGFNCSIWDKVYRL